MTKVRIYDLSRELDLENKQVLDICHRLNITAKTHSSSIPEEDAQRIRADIEKRGVPKQNENGNGKSSAQNGKNGKKHQQILEVRHHKPRVENNPTDKQNGEGSGDSPQLKGPPRRPNPKTESPKDFKPKPKAKKPSQETTPSVSENGDDQTPVSEPATPPSPNNTEQPSATKPVESPEPPIESLNKPEPPQEKATETEASENQQLLGPPSKPKPPKKEGKKVEKPKKPEKPTLKSSEDKPKPQPEPEKPTTDQKPQSVAKTEEKDQKPKKPAKPKMLAKPKRSKDKEPEPQDQEEELLTTAKEEPEEETSDESEVLLEQPKRPRPKRVETPTRHGKKKGWEEEEDDPEKAEPKTQKKRRPKPIIEDDDDELVLEEELDTPEEQSIALRSLERPPKPEALQRKSSPPAKSSPSKPKKNKSAANQPSTQRSQRQDKEQRRERPEEIILTEGLAVPELAQRLAVSETEIIKHLFFKGIQVNITQTLELETARMVAEDLGVTVIIPEKQSAATKTEMLDLEDLENLQSRPPVVTIMGHVDHGKTSLLDSIRKTKVAEGEAGGITQHTGAYHVDVAHEDATKQVVFLDTPGHEAFTAMRARGAKVTDIAVLVVAADDGVQPQTQEAISHAKAAGVPIVVAINKMDKEGAQPDRVKQELTEHELVPEEWGGNTPMVGVSAITGDNLDELLEMIILVAELEELSANPNRLAKGTVIEANLDRARGPVATLLVQNGTLHVGDVIVAGPCFGKIRAMIDDRGNRVEAASPSFAVEVLGLSDVPSAGDEFAVYAEEKEARAIAAERTDQMRTSRLQRAASSRRVTLSNVSEQAQEGELKELNLIIKADVQGSVEAIQSSLAQLPQNEVQIRVLFAAPGEVTETDVDLAAASGAVIIGFNTTLASNTKAAADKEGVDIREYDIIYKLLDEIQGAMEGLLDPEEVESPLGTAEVRAVFPVGRGTVAGCYVQSGRLVRNRRMRVRRKEEVVYDGNMDSLKRVKDDVKEVQSGFECGVGSNKFNDWKEGDIIEAYEMVMKRRTLSPNN